MNRNHLRLITLIGLLLGLLTACSRHYYGVHEDDWHRLSDSERAEVIRLYQQRQLEREKRRAAEAERRRVLEAERLRVAEEERRRMIKAQPSQHEVVKHQSPYPKLIHLRLSGGSFYTKGKAYQYHQRAFQLKQGETRVLTLKSKKAKPQQQIKLWVRYLDGKVMLGDGKRYLRTLKYRDSWHRGHHYSGISFIGANNLNGISLSIGPKPFKQVPDKQKDGKKDRAKQERAKQERAKQERAKQERAKQERAKQERAKQERAKQEREKQERAKQERAKQERAKQERAKQEKEKQEKEKQEKEKQEKEKQGSQNSEKANCIERGKAKGREKSGLPYCDE